MKRGENIIDKTERFEIKHKILSFLIIMLLTIFIARFLVSIGDINITIKGFEFHHFYYGLILLIITSLIMLFKKGSFKFNLVLVAIALGLIIDELIFVGTKIRGPIEYNSTLSSVIILIIIFLLIIDLIFYFLKKKYYNTSLKHTLK